MIRYSECYINSKILGMDVLAVYKLYKVYCGAFVTMKLHQSSIYQNYPMQHYTATT